MNNLHYCVPIFYRRSVSVIIHRLLTGALLAEVFTDCLLVLSWCAYRPTVCIHSCRWLYMSLRRNRDGKVAVPYKET